MKTRLLGSALALGVVAIGCGQFLGLDDDPEPPPSTMTPPANADGSSSVSAEGGVVTQSEVPEGWELVELHRLPWSPAPTASQCEKEAPAEHYFGGPNDEPATCASCTCRGPTCEATLEFAAALNCSADILRTVSPERTKCPREPAIPTAGNVNARVFISGTPPAAECVAEATSEKITPPAWTEEIQLCPTKATRENVTACIRSAGGKECPSGSAFSVETRLYNEKFTDNRSCEMCGCTQAPGVCFGGSVKIFGNNSCNGLTFKEVSSICLDVKNLTLGQWSYEYTPPTYNVPCNTTGGQPVGNVERNDVGFVCCMPQIKQ